MDPSASNPPAALVAVAQHLDILAVELSVADPTQLGRASLAPPDLLGQLLEPRAQRGVPRVKSHCRFAVQLIHLIPDLLTYSVALLVKRQCDLTAP